MINKKLFVLSFLMSFVVLVGYLYAADNSKNYVALLNGATHTVASGNPGKSEYSFIGQPIVFDELGGENAVSRSAFASAFYIVQSSSITITNETEDKVYEDIKVELKVKIESTAGEINKIKYRVWQGENPDWNDYTTCPEVPLSSTTDFRPAKTVNIVSTYTFSNGQEYNYFKFYAQTENGSKRWSEVYRVRLTPDLSADIKFTSPDSVTAVASPNPKIETTKFSLNYKPVTISLYEGTEQDRGEEIYTVKLDTESVRGYEIYNSTNSFISCDNSELYKLYKNIPSSSTETLKLGANKKYFLEIYPTESTELEPKKDVVEFKVVSDGVANIVTYPSPFNPKKQKIKIRYVLADTKNVTIRLYDKAGKVVCKLVDGEERSAGTNEEEWDGKNYAGETLATGAYIVEIIAGSDRRYTALAIVGK